MYVLNLLSLHLLISLCGSFVVGGVFQGTFPNCIVIYDDLILWFFLSACLVPHIVLPTKTHCWIVTPLKDWISLQLGITVAQINKKQHGLSRMDNSIMPLKFCQTRDVLLSYKYNTLPFYFIADKIPSVKSCPGCAKTILPLFYQFPLFSIALFHSWLERTTSSILQWPMASLEIC